jgi:hypothetical protein
MNRTQAATASPASGRRQCTVLPCYRGRAVFVASSKGQFCRVFSVHGIDSCRFATARTNCVHGCKVVYYRMHAKMQAACLIVALPWCSCYVPIQNLLDVGFCTRSTKNPGILYLVISSDF